MNSVAHDFPFLDTWDYIIGGHVKGDWGLKGSGGAGSS